MNAEIISVGTELLLGKVVNIDTTIIAKELAGIGINLLHAVTIGDNPKRLEDAVKLALSRSDILITTGGLGPTVDDLTKETVVKTAGNELEFREDCYKRLLEQFPGLDMTENQKKQVMLPVGCTVLENDNGTAPGCVFKIDEGKTVMMFPGPPSELTPMLNNYGIPYLVSLSGNTQVIRSHNIHIYGRGEAPVAEMIHDLIDYENPTVAPYAKEGECFVRVTAKAENEVEADKMCAPIIKDIMDRVGDYVYSIDIGSLEALVVTRLKERSMTIATAESCTGGYLAKRITDISGSSEVFNMGCVTYSNDVKTKLLGVKPETLEKYGAVSEETAYEMAKGMKELSGADIAVSITGIAGPDGGSDEKPVGLVYIGVAYKDEVFVSKRTAFGRMKNREWHRFVSGSHALDMVRRVIENLPLIK